jgi:hypothetical protein
VKFTVEVTPGYYTTEEDLEMQSPAIRAALDLAVGDVANNVYPEFTFGGVTVEAGNR